RLPLNQLTPYLLPFAHNSPHQKKPRDRNSPDPRLPTLARMVSPDAYTANANALYAESKMSGRHYITFRDSKHAAFPNSVSKTRQIIFSQQWNSTLLGKSG
ncbi:MAG: hypothetical protein NTX48_07260, partial [Planctomycetales bacterium]|nr:hypothetical protein [Planctomycetales bacterium]